MVDLPLICDAGNGYDNEVNVVQTVRLFRKAGTDAIRVEDQVSPKGRSHSKAKR